ncbi:MAG: glycosyltransferase family 9 protein [Candidatus Eisenbacteria bacterium]|nr:glycosyltransferase family 9 protein [Candidatus Eisenbacteria bacterium]
METERHMPYRNALVIQTGFVGDMVLTSPLLRALRNAAPEGRLTLLHDPRTEGIVRACPHLDERIVYRKRGEERGFRAGLRLVRRLRAARYDLVVSPHRSIRSGLLAFLSGAPRRIGFRHPSCSLFYTDVVDYNRWEGTFIRRKLRLLEPLGVEGADETPELYLAAEDREEARLLLGDAEVRPPYAVLAVGSAWPTKRWPAERFGELAALLAADGIASVAVGGPDEKDAGRRAAAIGPLADLTGRTGLGAVGALLEGAALFVGNDSGVLHMARAARTPAVALFGPTGPEQFAFDSLVRVVKSDEPCAPCSDHGGRECPRGAPVCLARISAARVKDEASALLRAAPEPADA